MASPFGTCYEVQCFSLNEYLILGATFELHGGRPCVHEAMIAVWRVYMLVMVCPIGYTCTCMCKSSASRGMCTFHLTFGMPLKAAAIGHLLSQPAEACANQVADITTDMASVHLDAYLSMQAICLPHVICVAKSGTGRCTCTCLVLYWGCSCKQSWPRTFCDFASVKVE